MYEVTIRGGDGEVLRRLELQPGQRLRIGRSQDCDVQLPMQFVSRQHAEVVPLPESSEWVLRDLESTHGTIVQGQRIREVTIRAGLEVKMGPAVLRFEDLTSRIGAEMDAEVEDEDDETMDTGPIVSSYRDR